MSDVSAEAATWLFNYTHDFAVDNNIYSTVRECDESLLLRSNIQLLCHLSPFCSQTQYYNIL
jgi:hypothetical protein